MTQTLTAAQKAARATCRARIATTSPASLLVPTGRPLTTDEMQSILLRRGGLAPRLADPLGRRAEAMDLD